MASQNNPHRRMIEMAAPLNLIADCHPSIGVVWLAAELDFAAAWSLQCSRGDSPRHGPFLGRYAQRNGWVISGAPYQHHDPARPVGQSASSQQTHRGTADI